MPTPKPRAYKIDEPYSILSASMHDHMKQPNPHYDFSETTRAEIIDYLVSNASVLPNGEFGFCWRLDSTLEKVRAKAAALGNAEDRERALVMLTDDRLANRLIWEAQIQLADYYLSENSTSFDGNDSDLYEFEVDFSDGIFLYFDNSDFCLDSSLVGLTTPQAHMKTKLDDEDNDLLCTLYRWIKTLNKDLSQIENEIIHEMLNAPELEVLPAASPRA